MNLILLLFFFFSILVQEGYFLWKFGKDPYQGSVFHAPPLYLYLLDGFFFFETIQNIGYVFLSLDLLNLVLVYLITRQLVQRGSFPEFQHAELIPCFIYAVNPLCLLTSAGLSTSLLTSTFLLGALASLLHGHILSIVLGSLLFGLTIYTNFLCIILIPAFLLLIPPPSLPSRLLFAGLSAAALLLLYALSHQLHGSWLWLDHTIGFQLRVDELTPNIGLLWYLFTEMFADFLPFYRFSIPCFALALVAPLTLKFRRRPLFLLWLLLSLITVFRSYPSVAELALQMTLLTFLLTELSKLSYKLFLFTTLCFLAILAYIFHYIWLYSGTGNANFYFAICIVLGAVEISLVGGMMSAVQISDYTLKMLNH